MSFYAARDAGGTTRNISAGIDGSGQYNLRHVMDSKLVVPVTPTVDTTAYADGDVVGGILTFANAARGGDQLSGVINSVLITDKSNQQGSYDLLFFDSTPSGGGTFTDQSPVAITTAWAKFLGFVTINAWTAAGTGSCGGQALPDLRYVLTSTSLFAVLVAHATPTFAASTDLTVRLALSRD